MKQVGMAFRLWATDNNDHLPMQISVTNGGTMERVTSGFVFPHFQVMSNELATPKVLLCPEDKHRSSAANFAGDLTDEKLSYFLNVDAMDGDATSLLSGDRNITNKASGASRLVNLTKAATIAWTKELHSEAGYLSFGDGRVDAVRNQSVAGAIQIPEGVTNRLAVP